MNCYICLVETGCTHQPAFALCQQCGAGVCAKHLVELTFPPIVGMGGERSARQSLICRRCYRSAVPPSRPAQSQQPPSNRDKQETTSGWNWWSWLRGHQQTELPHPEEAVAAAELFLKRQRHR